METEYKNTKAEGADSDKKLNMKNVSRLGVNDVEELTNNRDGWSEVVVVATDLNGP